MVTRQEIKGVRTCEILDLDPNLGARVLAGIEFIPARGIVHFAQTKSSKSIIKTRTYYAGSSAKMVRSGPGVRPEPAPGIKEGLLKQSSAPATWPSFHLLEKCCANLSWGRMMNTRHQTLAFPPSPMELIIQEYHYGKKTRPIHHHKKTPGPRGARTPPHEVYHDRHWSGPGVSDWSGRLRHH